MRHALVVMLVLATNACQSSPSSSAPSAKERAVAAADQSVKAATAAAAAQPGGAACGDVAALRADALGKGTAILKGVALAASTPIATVNQEMAKREGQVVQIEGRVTAICPGAGCWASLKDASGQELMLKVEDGTVDFRKLLRLGQYVVGEGTVRAAGEHGAEVNIMAHGARAGTLECPK